MPRTWWIHGVDFTSRPSRRKPVTIATGALTENRFNLKTIEECPDWGSFEHWLRRDGPWIAGFDFPFGLPREAVLDLGLPQHWPQLVDHCRGLGREAFRALLDAYRLSRPFGNRYPHRVTDAPARSHSPLKLVNPPVGLMFLEGAPRIMDADLHIPGLCAGDLSRVAVEAYPGFAARGLVKGSYKNDAKAKQTPERARVRRQIVRALVSGKLLGISLHARPSMIKVLAADPGADRLDAAICAIQAAWAWQRRESNYGLPSEIDPIEGWITTVP
ncbi:MAG: DUF429 domain-containing protein [Burkholderiales bacterium]